MAHELISQSVSSHLLDYVPPRDLELEAMEKHAAEIGFPIIGPVAGQLCYQTARMIGAKKIFEMGSGFGYSTAWFARAVQENGGGIVHHVVWDEQLSHQARKHLHALQLDHLVQFHVGEAIERLRNTQDTFDVIFNDIDKEDYPNALPVIDQKLRSGGVLIVDNMLWSGRIFRDDDRSPDTEGIRRFGQLIRDDHERWITTLVPIRDGVLLAMKK